MTSRSTTARGPCPESGRTADAKAEPGSVERPLDTPEAIFHAFNAVGAFLMAEVATVRGPMPVARVRAALAHVHARHPLLHARIRDDGGWPCWVTPPAPPPECGVLPAGADARAVAEAELHRPFDAGAGPLWRCLLIPGTELDGPHQLVLTFHHALADGTSAFQVLVDVVATCAALQNGRTPPPFLPAGPSAGEVLPPARWREIARHRLRNLGARFSPGAPFRLDQPALPADRRSAILVAAVPGATMGAVRERARDESTTVTGVLTAALLEAVRRVRGERPVWTVRHPVSLRRLASPPIPPEQVGCFVTELITRHSAGAAEPFWSVARQARRDLAADVAQEAVAGFWAARSRVASLVARLEREVRGRGRLLRAGGIGLSNRGRLTMGDLAPLAIESCWIATGNHPVGNALQLSCATVGETLHCALVHVEPLVSSATAGRVLEGFQASLARAAGPPSAARR